MLERYDPEHNWHILILHRRVELSSLVEKSGSIREVEERGSEGHNGVSSGSSKSETKSKWPRKLAAIQVRETPPHTQIASTLSGFS